MEDTYVVSASGDMNAHSSLYNCPKTNPRGRKLEDFFSNHDIVPANKGNKFTFEGGMGNSIIDVTMVTSRFADRIRNWRVSNKDMKSDHNMIEFEVELQKPETITYIDYRNGDYNKFN